MPPAPASEPRQTDIEASYHYRVMLRALAALDEGPPGMGLEALAAQVGMSTAHFQRVFSQWVGVSPKRYEQYLQLGLARALLARQRPLAEVAEGAGLSGTSRLHDLCLRWEAMSPGAIARGGEGLTIRHGEVDTPFGPAVGMVTDHGLCALGFVPISSGQAQDAARGADRKAQADAESVLSDLAGRWPAASFRADPACVRPVVEAATTGARAGSDVKLHVMGGPFQIKVWEALLRIPDGAVTTYSALAETVGHPRAARAVGTAVGRNPISWLIPCHRALRRSGALGGYHWGLPVKRMILAWEAARAETNAAARHTSH